MTLFELKRAFSQNHMYWFLAIVALVAIVFIAFLFLDFFSKEGRARRRGSKDFNEQLKSARKNQPKS
jgi:hypothetical protein